MKPNYFLMFLLVVLSGFVIYLYKPFLLDIIIATLLVLSTNKITKKLFKITKSNLVASILSTILLMGIFFAPIFYAIVELSSMVSFDLSTISQIQSYISSINLEKYTLITPQIQDFISNIDLNNVTKETLSYAAQIGSKSAVFIKDMILIIIFYFFITFYSYKILRFIENILPLSQNIFNKFAEESEVMSIVFYSIIITAFFEGVLFSIIGISFGYDGLLLGILYGFASLIPIVGGALLWLPLALLELSNGNTTNAIIISLYSIIIISIIADTFIKPLIIKYVNKTLLKTKIRVNELLVFFAIVAGLSTFGFWGMILGPAITTLFISILNIYKTNKKTW